MTWTGAEAVPAGPAAGVGPEEPVRPELHPRASRRNSPVNGVPAGMCVRCISFSIWMVQGALRPGARMIA
ncbi:MAG TPA: hypothetical protein VG500_14285 [Gemmatimonadales bacterium]|nr:hypothetical protein [Gemmatimonadales bacterium]